MRLSKLLIPTLKEVPSEAQITSHKLMLRAGLIRKASSGLYAYLPLGVKVLNKVSQIVREEMDRSGALEVSLPILVPRELLEASGRYEIFGNTMMRLVDRHDKEIILGPTHEEGITELVRQEVQSYKDLPLNLYQINLKFRDEIRPRFGVLRTREFLMKDAYSFHTDEDSLDETYQIMRKTYRRIFERCGLDTVPVTADSGAMGGSGSEEFMVRCDIGEETILECSQCDYVANSETAGCFDPLTPPSEEPLSLKLIDTPKVKTIEEVSRFLDASPKTFIKTLIYLTGGDDFIMVLIRGDLDVNEVKLGNALGGKGVALAPDDLISGRLKLPVGFLGPIDLKRDIKIIADHSISSLINGVTGGNTKDKHYTNVSVERDIHASMFTDLRMVKSGDSCISCKSPLTSFKGVEVGHIFKLGKKYTEIYKVNYLDEKGSEQTPTMGTYGIGINRIPAAVIEDSNDKNGIIWPMSIAPYHVVIVPISWDDDRQRDTAKQLYKDLLDHGVEVILDDRDLRPGVKFKDADLIGIPIRVNVGDKALAKDCVELKLRQDKDFTLVPVKDLCIKIMEIIAEAMNHLTAN